MVIGLHPLLQIWTLLVGLAVGSFMNVCIARMPEDRSVVSPGSHCPACGYVLRWYDNIPVLSWLILRARCRSCGSPISPLYPVIELLHGVLALLLFREIVPDEAAITVANFAAWAVFLVFIAMLLGATYIDLRHRIVPDQFSIYALPFGVLATLGLSRLGYDGPLALSWQQSVVGALVGGGLLLAVIGLWWVIRRVEAMGFGDVKLLAMMGAFLGALPAIPFIVLTSCLVGSAVGIALMIKQRQGLGLQLAFGPFLAVSAIVYVFFGDELLHRYLLAWVA